MDGGHGVVLLPIEVHGAVYIGAIKGVGETAIALERVGANARVGSHLSSKEPGKQNRA